MSNNPYRNNGTPARKLTNKEKNSKEAYFAKIEENRKPDKPEHPKIQELLDSLSITKEDLPDKWNIFSFNSKLEFIGDRILINSRKGITKHSELKDFLSPTQLERRYRREIQSKNGGWDDDIRHGEYWRHYNYELDKKPHKRTE
jgi:hypothetical protein